jgi:hypothetical protein
MLKRCVLQLLDFDQNLSTSFSLSADMKSSGNVGSLFWLLVIFQQRKLLKGGPEMMPLVLVYQAPCDPWPLSLII